MTQDDRETMERCFEALERRLVLLETGMRMANCDLISLKAVLIALRRKPGMSADELLALWQREGIAASEQLEELSALALKNLAAKQRRRRRGPGGK